VSSWTIQSAVGLSPVRISVNRVRAKPDKLAGHQPACLTKILGLPCILVYYNGLVNMSVRYNGREKLSNEYVNDHYNLQLKSAKR
jgi:hypothetical protein